MRSQQGGGRAGGSVSHRFDAKATIFEHDPAKRVGGALLLQIAQVLAPELLRVLAYLDDSVLRSSICFCLSKVAAVDITAEYLVREGAVEVMAKLSVGASRGAAIKV